MEKIIKIVVILKNMIAPFFEERFTKNINIKAKIPYTVAMSLLLKGFRNPSNSKKDNKATYGLAEKIPAKIIDNVSTYISTAYLNKIGSFLVFIIHQLGIYFY
ncbi:MAG: hypothetical protein V3V15_10480 [Sphingorhabdus sp.]